MDNNVRKEKIHLLQIKSKRNNIKKEMLDKGINLTLESFLEQQYSYDLLCDLFKKINNNPVELKQEIKFKHCHEKAVKELGLLFEKMPSVLLEKEVIFFHLHYRDTGAILIRLKDLFRDINWAVRFSGYSESAFDFAIVEPSFNFGICIETFEYWDAFKIWGLFDERVL